MSYLGIHSKSLSVVVMMRCYFIKHRRIHKGFRVLQKNTRAKERRLRLFKDELQAMRGVEVLERIATPEAHAWLTTLSKGDPFACATKEAAAALKRMEQE